MNETSACAVPSSSPGRVVRATMPDDARGPQPFLLERYFARFEFTTPHLLASSDCEALTLADLLALADPRDRAAWDGLRGCTGLTP